MEEKHLKREKWVELSSSEAEAIRGGIGLGDIKRLLKLIGVLVLPVARSAAPMMILAARNSIGVQMMAK